MAKRRLILLKQLKTMPKPKYPKTPTLDKMLKNKEVSQGIGEFLDWLQSVKEIHLCTHEAGHYEYLNEEDRKKVEDMAEMDARCWRYNNPSKYEWIEGYYHITKSIEQWLAEYFDTDLNAAEKERRAVLKYARKVNN